MHYAVIYIRRTVLTESVWKPLIWILKYEALLSKNNDLRTDEKNLQATTWRAYLIVFQNLNLALRWEHTWTL